MFSDFSKTVFQLLADRRLRRIVIRSVMLTFVGIIALSIGAAFLVPWAMGAASSLLGYDVSGVVWLTWTVGGVSGVGLLIMALLIFPSLSALVASLYLDQVSSAVEARYYPHLPPPRKIPVTEMAASSLRFAAVSFALNLLCLPVYLILLLFGIGPVVYWVLNGYLLSREFYEQAAFRRMTVTEANARRRRWRGALWLEGIALAVIATVPVVNLCLPVIGTACLSHFIQRKNPVAGH